MPNSGIQATLTSVWSEAAGVKPAAAARATAELARAVARAITRAAVAERAPASSASRAPPNER